MEGITLKLVVWFPGLGSFANVTGNILEFFENDPDTDVLTLSYDTFGLGGYHKAAERLVGPLQSLLDSYDLVYFLGHSMGGDVASVLVTEYGFKPDKIVRISTPPAPFKHLASSLLKFTGVLEDYCKECALPDLPILNIYGSLDILANPASPLFEQGGTWKTNVVSEQVTGHGHLSILWSTRAAAEVYAFCTYRD